MDLKIFIITIVITTIVVNIIGFLSYKCILKIISKIKELIIINNYNKKNIKEKFDDILTGDEILNDDIYVNLYNHIYAKYERANISIERAKIKQLLFGNKKEESISQFLSTVFSVFGSGLVAFAFSMSVFRKNEIFSYIAIVIGIIIIMLIISRFLDLATKETKEKILYYNLVLCVMDDIEKGIKYKVKYSDSEK
ncbi:hypothetical protein GNF78_00510 [Clostridium perfringens]|uniref:hypothetical protein n=1 Tax=Clostridium perfringens TaxID=1502 RepID=UPI0028542BEA|nr:hypothetical protein [Clostridium perfringens]EIL8446427.1 hypothetical protein [Clostridium perfringens]ELC8379964.1 hypothetical protein [Clostridium perfringens]MDY3359030.1 hypothetical protein [Clostridium celatum]MDZ5035682.1 hypothetical protein [Clostridium perfringens]